MGLVFKNTKGLIRAYPQEMFKFGKALIEPSKSSIDVRVAEMSGEEVEAAMLKLDQMAMSAQDERIATMIAEEAESILFAIRIVKMETKQPFQGILGTGASLDMQWLRPKHVGDSTLMNTDNTAALGLYLGTNAGVFNWLSPVVANTWATLIPSQKMVEEAAVIHLGAIEPIEVPKINAIEFQLSGIPSPVQSTNFDIRRRFGADGDVPFVRFERPVLVAPEKTQRVRLMPNITGDTRFELLSILVAKAETLTG